LQASPEPHDDFVPVRVSRKLFGGRENEIPDLSNLSFRHWPGATVAKQS